jgi:hypothetical protein
MACNGAAARVAGAGAAAFTPVLHARARAARRRGGRVIKAFRFMRDEALYRPPQSAMLKTALKNEAYSGFSPQPYPE